MIRLIVFLKLIRFPNLLIISLAQIITAFKLVYKIELFTFLIILFSTVFIAAGGYLLNNIEDSEIDKFNNISMQDYFSLKNMKIFYFLFSFFGLLFGFYVSYLYNYYYFFIFLLAFLILYVYAKALSKYKIIGNIAISFLVSLAIFMIPLFANINKSTNLTINDKYIFVLLMYILFAFIMNWVREIVKDIEDVEGDLKFGRRSIPIVFGIRTTKIILVTLLLFIVLLIIPQIFLLQYYLLLFVLMLIAFVIVKIFKADIKKDYSSISLYIKISMLFGILYPLLNF